MLPWARAVIYGREHNLPVLAPRWVQPRIGAMIRNEAVSRFYFREFTNDGYVKGLRKHATLLTGKYISEENICLANSPEKFFRPLVVVFQGLRHYFDDIRDHRDVLFAELHRIVNRSILERVTAASTAPFVAVHIRRGDFSKGNSIDAVRARYTPDEWFLAAIDAIKKDRYWSRLPIYVFSDANDSEFVPFNSAGCRQITTGSAVGDMLLLSKAQLLVGSGQSTFTMWASYFGIMPTLYCPGKMQQRVFTSDCKVFEGQWRQGEKLPPPQQDWRGE